MNLVVGLLIVECEDPTVPVRRMNHVVSLLIVECEDPPAGVSN